VLSGEPTAGPHEQPVRLRPATEADLPLIARLLEEGFGWRVADDLVDRLDSPRERTVIVEQGDSAVGTIRLRRDARGGAIHGFVIEASMRGRGIGRAALRHACEQLRADGAGRIGLEVDSTNDHALGLYTSVGFTPIITEDYFSLPIS
jgi:ribosomal protein S18 acetylase RimI-like enzyme